MMENIHKFPKFCIIKNILYKQTKDNLLIVLPSSLARLVVELSHRNMTIHPNANQIKRLLKSLFFSFDLERIIEDVPKSSLVCTASVPKFLRHQIGMQRSSTFFPNEHLVIDSAYLNASTEQF